MPKKSKATIKQEAEQAWLVEHLKALVDNPNTKDTARSKALGTLRGIQKEQARELAKRSAKVNDRRSARAQEKEAAAYAEMLSRVLPSNGREPPKGFVPVKSDCDSWPDLSVINR
jgi:hypothetical protein